MTDSARELAEQIVQLTGTRLPAVLDDAAPVLERQPESVYFIGLIGGKDVGKTSLINALVGRELSRPIGFGEGTDRAIAYCHASAVESVRAVLERVSPGKHEIVVHDNNALQSQVLVDLPDIDSRYADHVELTRKMLRHLLFPVWIQSIEKYADQQPRLLLQRVAEGNDPSNFLFVLSKIDLLADREGESAVAELRDDYAARLQRTLDLADAPAVFCTSAIRTASFDLPELTRLLARQKDARSVEQSQSLARAQRDRTVLRWIDEQQLPDQLARVERLIAEAREQLTARVASPIADGPLQQIATSAARRWAIVEEASRQRLSHWPVLRVFDTLLVPITSLLQKNIAPASSAEDPLLARSHIARQVQSVFAELHQTHPLTSTLLRRQAWWEPESADRAAMELTRRIDASLAAQRAEVVRSVARNRKWLAPFRLLLTAGALAWFPIIQPLLEIVLPMDGLAMTRELAWQIVRMLGATYLLQSVAFLAIYFVALWMWVRYDTWRSASRLLTRLQSATAADARTSPLQQLIDWTDHLLAPLESQRDELKRLLARVESLRANSNGATR